MKSRDHFKGVELGRTGSNRGPELEWAELLGIVRNIEHVHSS